jgi:hypothetical protein
VSALILAFGRTFESSLVPRIWETLITNSAPNLFLRYFASSLLMLSFPSFLAITSYSVGKLVAQMDSIFRGQDIGNTIGMTLALMKRSQAEIHTAKPLPGGRQIEKADIEPALRWVFRINMEYSELYEKSGQLFV